jgi:hypothetical protein
LIKRIGLGIDLSELIMTLKNLIVIMHLLGNLLAAASTNDDNVKEDNWVAFYKLKDGPIEAIYVTAVYWALIIAMTVGYGDIVPISIIEKIVVCAMFFIGIPLFSYFVGSMTTEFVGFNTSVSISKVSLNHNMHSIMINIEKIKVNPSSLRNLLGT